MQKKYLSNKKAIQCITASFFVMYMKNLPAVFLEEEGGD